MDNNGEVRRPARKVRRFTNGGPEQLSSTVEIASYVEEMMKGLRQVTRNKDRRDFKFLNYLLALAEQEAATLSSRSYH